MTHEKMPPSKRRFIGLWVPDEDHQSLKQEAESYGYDLSSLLRLRIYGKVKGMRITRRPSADMMLMGDIIGRLTAQNAEINKIGSNLNQIAKRLNQGSRDLFGLDSCLRLFEQVCGRILTVLDRIEGAFHGHATNHSKEE